MKKKKNKILITLAIINTMFIGFLSYLNTFMYQVHIEKEHKWFAFIIVVGVLLSIAFKLFSISKGIYISLFFDLFLILSLYDPLGYSDLHSFLYSLIDLSFFIYSIFYVYLIFFYIVIIRTRG